MAVPDRFASEVIGGRCGAGRSVFACPARSFQWRGFCRAAFVYGAGFLSAYELPDAICRFLQTFDPRRVGKSKVPLRRVAAEVQSRRYRDTG